MNTLKTITFTGLLLLPLTAWADGYNVYPTTPYGARDYSQGGYRIEQGPYGTTTVTPTTPWGGRDYSQGGYQIENGTAYPTKPWGGRDYSQPGWQVE